MGLVATKISKQSDMCLIDVRNAMPEHSRICISDRKGQGRHSKEVLFKPRKVNLRKLLAEEGTCRSRKQEK